MKYIVKSGTFELLDRQMQGNTIALKTVKTNRNIFLKKTAAVLLDKMDVELDFEEVTASIDPLLKRDMDDGLTLLECFGIAECTGRERDEFKPIRVAGERDYRTIARFIEENHGDAFGFVSDWNPEYYNEDNIRARQFNNVEYNFISLEDNEITGLIIAAPQKKASYSSSAIIYGALFKKELDTKKKEKLLKEIVSKISEYFKPEVNKIRFLESRDEHLKVCNVLGQMGFSKICTLEKESPDGGDVAVYDMNI